MRIAKPLAEESFILASGEIGRSLRSGSVVLRPKSEPNIRLVVNWENCPLASDGVKVRLWYERNSETQSYIVGLAASDAFGKRVRWRFECMSCHEQANKLFLPLRASRQKFLCRCCWGIDYTSHAYPRRASLRTVELLGEKIQNMEAELVRLSMRHRKLVQSLGLR